MPAAVRRWACDATMLGIREDDGGNPLEVARAVRHPSRRLRRALRARDGACRFPGCGAKAFLHAHHSREWTRHHRTKLSELVSLCYWHHHLVHEGG